jgi:hypothetical protein
MGLPFCLLLPAFKVPELNHGHKYVFTVFGIPDNEEINIAVIYYPH